MSFEKTIRLSPPLALSAPVQTGHGAYPGTCTMGTGSLPGVKRPGRDADHPPPSKCRDQERVGLYLYSPYGPSWPVTGAPLPLPLPSSTPINKRPFQSVNQYINISHSHMNVKFKGRGTCKMISI